MAEQKVSVIKYQSYGEDEVFSAVKSAVDLLGGQIERVKHGFLQKFLFGIYIWGVEISKKLLKMRDAGGVGGGEGIKV